MRFLKFIGYGVAYVLVPEFTNLVVIHRLLHAYVLSLLIYSLLLAVGYGIQKVIDRTVRGSVLPNLACIILFGFLGLVFEWTIVGQSPEKNPEAIQWGMFVYWVGLYMVPRILVDERDIVKNLARWIKRIYITYSGAHLVLALAMPVPLLVTFVPVIWTIVYTLLGAFYLKYVLLLREQNTALVSRDEPEITS